MSTKTREVIWGGRIMSAKMRAETARQEARKAARAADRAEAEAWSVRMEGYGGPAQPSPTIGQCLNGGYGWLEIECCRCKTRASMPLDAIRRARDTPIWKLEPSFRCRSCGTRRYKPPVRMIKLTKQRGITPTSGCILMKSDSPGYSNNASRAAAYFRKSFAAASLSFSRSRPIFRINSRACSTEMSCFRAK